MSEELAPLRVVARRAVARTLRVALDALVAQGHKAATQRAVAKRLDVSHTHLARLIADVAADGREDEHLCHAAALEKIAGIALRGAGAAKRRAAEGR